jgi:hypothetical protein
MELPSWMKIGEKSTLESLLIWGIPLLLTIGLIFAAYGSIDN